MGLTEEVRRGESARKKVGIAGLNGLNRMARQYDMEDLPGSGAPLGLVGAVQIDES